MKMYNPTGRESGRASNEIQSNFTTCDIVEQFKNAILNAGSHNEEPQHDHNTKHVLTQQAKALAWLQQAPLNTLQARQELYIMSIASCIFELKKRGHNIVTHKVLAGSKKIAQYVLLSGEIHE